MASRLLENFSTPELHCGICKCKVVRSFETSGTIDVRKQRDISQDQNHIYTTAETLELATLRYFGHSPLQCRRVSSVTRFTVLVTEELVIDSGQDRRFLSSPQWLYSSGVHCAWRREANHMHPVLCLCLPSLARLRGTVLN